MKIKKKTFDEKKNNEEFRCKKEKLLQITTYKIQQNSLNNSLLIA